MPANANRCPHCWAALSEHVTDFCPHCRRSLVANQKRRDDHHRAAPAQPLPVPTDDAMAAASVGGGVAVAERDPVEFPGTPLPFGFFDALPEKVRNPRVAADPGEGHRCHRYHRGERRWRRLSGPPTATRTSRRRPAISSRLPAPNTATSPPAWPRTPTMSPPTRRRSAGSRTTSAASPRLPGSIPSSPKRPMLSPGSIAPSRPTSRRFDALSDDQLEALEDPLVHACYNGVGRA